MISGSIFTDAISFFIIVATAMTLLAQGIEIESAADAARALGPLAGEHAKLLFGVGFIAASVLAAAILPLSTAYVVCEAFGWESGVGKKWSEAPFFNGIFTAMLLLGAALVMIPNINLITLLIVTQSLNGILLPIILIYTVKLATSKRLMGEFAIGRIHGAFTWACAAVVISLTAYLLLQPLIGP